MTKSIHNHGFVGDPDAPSPLYFASSDLKAEVKLTFNVNFLTLATKGIVLGMVQKVSGKMTNGTISSTCWDILGWTNTAPNPDFNRVCRSLVADRDAGGQKVPISYIQAFNRIRKNLSPASDACVPDLINEESQPVFVAEYLQRVNDIIWERKFFSVVECSEAEMKQPLVRPGEHLIGLTSGDVRPGDLVCILFGCSVPLVISPFFRSKLFDTKVHGKLVDECFVYGMMDGEAFQFKSDIILEDMSREIILI
ncbi:hypothetical protein RRF57_007197 [Xylaria bambusicola]|uniref:Uncharacterized protein n=1 Tax=Xylaria bambusicola TaxID=326684 RepID=A0AAN7UKR3_9PEZI